MYLVFIKNPEDTTCWCVEGMHSEVFYSVEKVEVVNIEKSGESKLVFDSEDNISDS